MEKPRSNVVLHLEAGRFRRVVVLRALQLGDLLCAVPAFRALRSALPSARVSLVGLPWARDFVDRFDAYLDDFIEFPGYPGLPERAVDVRSIPPFLSAMQGQSFDLAIQMQGDGSVTNALVALFGARSTAGFHVPGQPAPEGAALVPYPSSLSEVRRLLCLVERLGALPCGEDLEFSVRDWEEREWCELRSQAGLEGSPYACVHAGARDPARRWTVEGFAAVARALAERGVRPVLTGEGVEESRRAAEIASACGAGVVDLVGRTPLGVLAAAIRGACVVVCNDTGVSHLADALRVPSVVVFLTTDPARWAPLDRGRHRVVRADSSGVRDVVAALRALLGGEGRRAA